jgi:hypothetical protein
VWVGGWVGRCVGVCITLDETALDSLLKKTVGHFNVVVP